MESPANPASSHCAHPGAGCAVGSGHCCSWGPAPSLGGQDGATGIGAAQDFASITLAPLQCCRNAGLGVLAVPGPSPGLCGDPCLPQIRPAWPAGAGPHAQPSAAAVTQLMPPHQQPPGVIQVRGIHFPQPFPPQTLAQPSSGGAPASGYMPGPGGTLSRDTEGRDPCPLQHRAPTLCRYPTKPLHSSPEAPQGPVDAQAGPHAEAGASCATCGNWGKAGYLEQSWAQGGSSGALRGFAPATACPPAPCGQGSPLPPWDRALWAPGQHHSRTLSPASPRDAGQGCGSPDPGHAPSPHGLTIQPVTTDEGSSRDEECTGWPSKHVSPSQHLRQSSPAHPARCPPGAGAEMTEAAFRNVLYLVLGISWGGQSLTQRRTCRVSGRGRGAAPGHSRCPPAAGSRPPAPMAPSARWPVAPRP